MKLRWKLAIAFAAAAVLFGVFQLWSGNEARRAAQETHRQLRAEGFKTGLSDFDFTVPAKISANMRALTAISPALQELRHTHDLQLMQAVGTNVALSVWPIEIIETYQSTNLWPLIEEELSPLETELDRVCVALSAGPVKFQPTINPNGSILLPYLADHKSLSKVLAVRAVLAMHEGNTNAVFTNLLALSRTVTGWSPEPVDISHMVRFACVDVARQAIWESMQTDYWNETQLASLQREWESANFLVGLPATAQLSCASMISMCQTARNESYGESIGGWGPLFREITSSPGRGFKNLPMKFQSYRQHSKYRNEGSYIDEKALLLYFRDRYREMQRAVACPTWTEMRALPGATNIVVFQGHKPSRIHSLMNLKQLNLAFQGQGQGSTLLSRAAATEANRRLIVTAIALERYAIQHREYPASLAGIVPAFLPAVPLDFMDGEELRYRRLKDGRYLLYSVGLDCEDNGGRMITPEHLSVHYRPMGGPPSFPHSGRDIVWPLRATQADVDLFDQQRADYLRSLPESIRNYRPDDNPDSEPFPLIPPPVLDNEESPHPSDNP